jgi:poly(3-hydroxybutyrate) depolymerase
LWSTCLNDDKFAEDVLGALGADFCFDLDAVFVSGMSNGGIFAHYVAAKNPNQWKGVLPVFGSPLQGYIDVSFALKGTSFMQLHGRSDNVIPYAGGLSSQGWYYESMDDVAFAWGEVNGCDEDSRSIVTPYDGSKNLACLEHPDCTNGVRVIRCLYDGGHSPPSIYNDLAYWFMTTTLEASVSTHYRNATN